MVGLDWRALVELARGFPDLSDGGGSEVTTARPGRDS